jgi:hypothetical protein
MRTLLILSMILTAPLASAEEPKPTADAAAASTASSSTPAAAPVKPEEVDISDLEHEYWRPSKDELEVVQNKKYGSTE